jgi:hypothetical protein
MIIHESCVQLHSGVATRCWLQHHIIICARTPECSVAMSVGAWVTADDTVTTNDVFKLSLAFACFIEQAYARLIMRQ